MFIKKMSSLLFCIVYLLVAMSVVIPISSKSNVVYAEPTCAYIVRTPTQEDIDYLKEHFPYDDDDPLIRALENRERNGGDWLYVYCRPPTGETEPEQYILTSENYLVDRSLEFVSLYNPNTGFTVPNNNLDSLDGTEDTIDDTGLAEDFITENDADGDGVPDDVTPPRVDGTPVDPPPPLDEEDEDETPKCEEEFEFPGAWLACLFLQIVDDFTNEAIDAVNSMLAIEEGEVNNDSLRQAWSYFRNIASLLLVIIGLAMIIGQAISKE